MKTLKDHKNISKFHEKEVLHVRKGRKKRKTELNRLRRLEILLRETSPEQLNAFDEADRVRLNTPGENVTENPISYDTLNPTDPETLQNHNTGSEAPTVTSQVEGDSFIDEMLQAYNVHLAEFDLNLFEDLC
jgi:hypothetical protein